MNTAAINSSVATYEGYTRTAKATHPKADHTPKATPQDTYTPSKVEDKEVTETSTKKSSISFENFDREAFRGEINAKLLEMVSNAKPKDGDAKTGTINIASDILYQVEDGVEAADVPEYWNAENTSDRLVDFAMSFRSLANDLDDESYVNTIRNAIEEGFKQAKATLGNLPGPSGKLFNDTYNLTMEKLDKVLGPKA